MDHRNFLDLANNIHSYKGKLVIFVGAGMSKLTSLEKIVSWKELLIDAKEKLEGYQICISGSDIYKDMETLICEKHNYLYAAWIFKKFVGDDNYRSFLEQKFSMNVEYSENILGRFLKFIDLVECKLILTTNYDKVLENSLNKDPDKVAKEKREGDSFQDKWSIISNDNCESARNKISIGEKLIFKIHGTIDKLDTIIFTHEDYQKLYYNRNDYLFLLSKIFDSNTILFLGFSLTDPFLTTAFDMTSAYYGCFKQNHYAIIEGVNNAEIYAWENLRGVKIIPLENGANNYLESYISFFDELIAKLSGGKSSGRTKIEYRLDNLDDWINYAGDPNIVEDEESGRNVLKVNYVVDKIRKNNSSVYMKLNSIIKSGETVKVKVDYKCEVGINGMIFVGDAGGIDPYDNSVSKKGNGTGKWNSITAEVKYKHDDVCLIFLYGNREGGKEGDFVLYRNLVIEIYKD